MKHKEQFITPAGEASFPWIQKPKTQFNPEGSYTLELKLDPNVPEVAALIEQLESETKAHFAELASKDKSKKSLATTCRTPVCADVDRETGQETGLVVLKFKSSYRPGLFDAKRNPIGDEPMVGSGSIVKVAYSKNFYPGFGGGMNLYLNAVQVLKLVEFGGKGSCPSGFGEEEGGFEADQPPPPVRGDAFEGDLPDGTDGFDPAKLEQPDAIPGDDPADPEIDAVISSEEELLARIEKAKFGYTDLREIFAAVKGNKAMFKIRLKTALKLKGF